MIFEDFEVIQSVLLDTSKVVKKYIIAEQDAFKMPLNIKDLAKEFVVLQIEKKSEEEHYFTYEFSGIASHKYRSDFGMFILKFRSAKVCWDELVDDSWFVNR